MNEAFHKKHSGTYNLQNVFFVLLKVLTTLRLTFFHLIVNILPIILPYYYRYSYSASVLLNTLVIIPKHLCKYIGIVVINYAYIPVHNYQWRYSDKIYCLKKSKQIKPTFYICKFITLRNLCNIKISHCCQIIW